mmetsp:Transcript_21599/g.60023  ORF Transcript_21599/g.60023 Transcript_21599/m.60023 type:complete len:284 (+) Transcript_21599:143-994(+)|eukprot:CAMPEP_0117665990 /NCGR_PEP_ID=MMETSP0804-20121206/10120_1 /TAXON_ID=1074897 /ORGANISM="Tetraselmis astigmatica, Strain CCMP880" /LENGTH=283 /DNA_ID=CAMNT_0005473471 /DNA_START=143 /DNA_END=994 /DNA_ORIENTATION=+
MVVATVFVGSLAAVPVAPRQPGLPVRRASVPRIPTRPVRVCASAAAPSLSHDADQPAKSLESSLADLGFSGAAASTSASSDYQVFLEASSRPWWEHFAARIGLLAVSAVAALFVTPGYASAATSNGRAGGSAFASKSSYSPGPSSTFKGTPVSGPTKSSVAVNSSAAAAAPAPTSTTNNSVTNNKTTVVNKTEAVHHHHTTVVAAPAPCPTSTAIAAATTVAAAATTAAVLSSAPAMHAPMAPMMGAPVVASPVVSYSSTYMMAGIVVALAAVLALFVLSRRN